MACGDLSGYDADSCYELGDDYTPHNPVQPPLSAAYLDVCRKARVSTGAEGLAKRANVDDNEEKEEENQILSKLLEATHLN